MTKISSGKTLWCRHFHQIREMSSNKRAHYHEEEEEKDNSPGSLALPKKVRLDKEMSLQVSLFDYSTFIR